MNIPENSIVTLCTKCGSLVVITADTYKDMEKYINKPIPNQFKSKNLTIEKLPYYEQFMNSMKRSRQYRLNLFPLCMKCIDSISKYQEKYNKIINETISAIDGSTNQIYQCRAYMNDVQNADMPEIPTRIIFQNDPDEKYGVIEKKSVPPVEKPKMSPYFALPFFAYKIAVNDFFGVINSMRVGTLEHYQVPVEEIQNGLYCIIRILMNLFSSLRLPTSYITLSKNIVFHIQNQNLEFNYPTSRKEYKTFNVCLSKMMEMFELAFDYLSKKGTVGPNLIVSAEKKIGDIEYTLHSNDTVGFTLAMRALLIDIKTVQVYQYKSHFR